MPMDQLSRFVVWLCSKFPREHLEFINKELSDILQGRKEFPVDPKDTFREKDFIKIGVPIFLQIF